MNERLRTYLADTAISAYRGVTISGTTGGVGVSATAKIPDGFVERDVAAGDYVAVRHWMEGATHKGCLTASPCTVGDTLYAGATGYVSTTGTVVVGKAITTTGGAAAANDDAVIEFVSRSLA